MPEIDRIVTYFVGGETQVFIPETAPPPDPEPEPEPEPDVISWDFEVAPDAPNLDVVLEPPWRGFALDYVWTAGPSKSSYLRTQIGGLAEYGGPAKPWINNRMIWYLVLSRNTWKLRHGYHSRQEDKITDSDRLTVHPGDAFRITGEVDLEEGTCWAEILPLQGNSDAIKLGLRNVPPQAIRKVAILRLGEPEPEGQQGPWLNSKSAGFLRILR